MQRHGGGVLRGAGPNANPNRGRRFVGYAPASTLTSPDVDLRGVVGCSWDGSMVMERRNLGDRMTNSHQYSWRSAYSDTADSSALPQRVSSPLLALIYTVCLIARGAVAW